DAHIAELDRSGAAIDIRQAAAMADLDAVPDGAEVDDAARQAADAEGRVAAAEEHMAASRRALSAAEEAVRSSLRALTTIAARHQLPTTPEGLVEVEGAVALLERS